MLGATPEYVFRLLGPLFFNQIAHFDFIQQAAKMTTQIGHLLRAPQHLGQTRAVQPGVVFAQRRGQPGILLFQGLQIGLKVGPGNFTTRQRGAARPVCAHLREERSEFL